MGQLMLFVNIVGGGGDEPDGSWAFKINIPADETPLVRFFVTMSNINTELNVDWGDGDTSQYTTSGLVWHTYSTTGEYDLVFTGDLGGVSGAGIESIKSYIVETGIIGLLGITTFEDTFGYCAGLTSIPSGLFKNYPLLEGDAFRNTFRACTGLASIPSGLFDKQTLVTGFSATFQSCTGLTSIPSGLFDKNTLVESFSFTFSHCGNLASIPSGLFDKNTAVLSFGSTFEWCRSLTTIPSGLFDENTQVENFYMLFTEDRALTAIPSGLFDNNVLVGDYGFFMTFTSCTGLTSVPSGLFDNNTLVGIYGFSWTFDYCTGLTSIPSGLFSNNNLCTSWEQCFRACYNLTMKADIFPSSFLPGATINVKSFFDLSNSAFTGTPGVAPELWNLPVTFSYSNCFDSTMYALTNYSSIPSGWL